MKIYFAVIKRDRLTEAIDELLRYDIWFGVEPWPNNNFALQVKPESAATLRSIVQGMEVSNNGDSNL